jgi:anti-sigma factor RsiW
MSDCPKIVPLLDAFVDGELPPERLLEVEQHLEACELCVEHLSVIDAMRVSTRRAVQQAAAPSEALRARVASALAAERLRERTEDEQPGVVRRLGRWTLTAIPLAAAAAAMLLITSAARRPEAPAVSVDRHPTEHVKTMSVADTVEALLDELVSAHAAPPAPQITEPTLVGNLEPEVGVPVHLPSLASYGARWEGGSVIPVRNENHAALFRYRLSNRPVTVYVYDARRVPLRAVLEPRVVHDVPIHVGAHRGYSIAAREQRGVGYAVATDLTSDESAELVAAIH